MYEDKNERLYHHIKTIILRTLYCHVPQNYSKNLGFIRAKASRNLNTAFFSDTPLYICEGVIPDEGAVVIDGGHAMAALLQSFRKWVIASLPLSLMEKISGWQKSARRRKIFVSRTSVKMKNC